MFAGDRQNTRAALNAKIWSFNTARPRRNSSHADSTKHPFVIKSPESNREKPQDSCTCRTRANPFIAKGKKGKKAKSFSSWYPKCASWRKCAASQRVNANSWGGNAKASGGLATDASGLWSGMARSRRTEKVRITMRDKTARKAILVSAVQNFRAFPLTGDRGDHMKSSNTYSTKRSEHACQSTYR